MDTVRNFSISFHERYETYFNHAAEGLDVSSRYIGTGIDQIISKLNIQFSDSRVEKQLKSAWTWVKNPTIGEDESTRQAVKKAAFAFFISLPVIFLFKDIIAHSKFENLQNISSLSSGATQLIKTFLYLYVVMSVIDFILSFKPEETPATTTETEAIKTTSETPIAVTETPQKTAEVITETVTS